ncbi:MAG: hypothetical protein IJJ60_02245, partial [Clostridia bacterium]|nr:hypothetical protein [Clostridia bacterium]
SCFAFIATRIAFASAKSTLPFASENNSDFPSIRKQNGITAGEDLIRRIGKLRHAPFAQARFRKFYF